jgi:hypothetical protein
MDLFGLDDGFPPKPKGMHWRTYRRLEQLDKHLADRWCVGMAGFLERVAALAATARPSTRCGPSCNRPAGRISIGLMIS